MTISESLPAYASDNLVGLKRISWPAIFSGIFVALGMELVFIAFGLFIGFTLSSPNAITTWSQVWYFVTCFVSLLVGGWVAARLASNFSGSGVLHGLVTWGVTMMTTFALALVILFAVTRSAISVAQTAVNAATTTSATETLANRAATDTTALPAPGPRRFLSVVTNDASTVSLVVFGGLLCGMFASMVGGVIGDRRRLALPPQPLPPPVAQRP